MFSDFILKMLNDILNANNSGLTEVIKQSPDVAYPQVWAQVVGIYTSVALPLGLGLMIVLFLINIVTSQIEQNSQITIQGLIKPMLGFIIGITIMLSGVSGSNGGKTIFINLYEVGHALTNSLTDFIGDGQDQAQTLEDKLLIVNSNTQENFAKIEGDEIVLDKGFKMLDGWGAFFSVFFAWIPVMVGSLYGMFIVYGRTFELLIRYAFAPIALADMFVKGTDSAGFKYIREFLALVLQGSLILLVIHIFGMVRIDSLGDGFSGGGLMAYISMFIAQLALLGRTKTIAQNLVGL